MPKIYPQYATSTEPDHLLMLYTQHADSARALACRLIYDRYEAEDIVQDVFVGLYGHPECFDPQRGTSRAWLLTVVRNRTMDRLRRRAGKFPEDVDELADRLADPHTPDVLEAMDAAVRDERLWLAVESLPRCQAELIRRAYLGEQTHQQIAAETGLPLGTVKSRIRLGLEKLRGSIGGPATLVSVAC